MPIAAETRDEYHALFRKLVRARREIAICAYQCDAFVTRVMIELDVPPGYAIDWHGDGQVKPVAECRRPET